MKQTHISRKMIVSVFTGMIIIPGSAVGVNAAENNGEQSFVQTAGIESVLENCYETDVKENINLYLVPTEEGEYLNIAFSDTGDFTYIRSAPDENSEWVGKLYRQSAAQVLEYLDGWTRIRSGTAEGYVPAGALITGRNAEAVAADYECSSAVVTADVLNVRAAQGTENDILTQVVQGDRCEITGDSVNGWYPIRIDETEGWVSGEYVEVVTSYSYGETREEEESRLAAEKLQNEKATDAAVNSDATEESEELAGTVVNVNGEVSYRSDLAGQAVVDYACQFIGNPYVWGGTSLTDGADCSGFVQSVYAHFGVDLPRTTYEMVNSGYEVNYSDALPGDLILYDGHVGLYMGDGNIVNAMNEKDGIGICSATYTNILTVRRVI